MSIDWYVTFSGEAKCPPARPDPEHIGMVVEDFLGPVLKSWERSENGSWWTFSLGPRSERHPLTRTFPDGDMLMLNPDAAMKKFMNWDAGRWLQIFYPPDGSQFAIILRHQQDEFVSAIALGLAQVFARRWHGTIQEPS
jgi:hypothetical protein